MGLFDIWGKRFRLCVTYANTWSGVKLLLRLSQVHPPAVPFYTFCGCFAKCEHAGSEQRGPKVQISTGEESHVMSTAGGFFPWVNLFLVKPYLCATKEWTKSARRLAKAIPRVPQTLHRGPCFSFGCIVLSLILGHKAVINKPPLVPVSQGASPQPNPKREPVVI